MIDKSSYICTIPFKYSEVFKNKHYLCCPGWLTKDVYDTSNIKADFHNKHSQDIRNSILDGSYKYCSDTQCPHLSLINQGKDVDRRFIPKTDSNVEYLTNNVNLKNINLNLKVQKSNLENNSKIISFNNPNINEENISKKDFEYANMIIKETKSATNNNSKNFKKKRGNIPIIISFIAHLPINNSYFTVFFLEN